MEQTKNGAAPPAPPIMPETTVVAAREQISSTLGREAVILGLVSGVYYGLNEVGNRLWELVQTPRTVASLVEAVVAEFDVTQDVCERDVLALVREMARERLVEVVAAPHDGMSGA